LRGEREVEMEIERDRMGEDIAEWKGILLFLGGEGK
jgi:hypothetical protein